MFFFTNKSNSNTETMKVSKVEQIAKAKNKTKNKAQPVVSMATEGIT